MKSVTLLGRGPSWKECRFETDECWGLLSCLSTEEMENINFAKVFGFDSLDWQNDIYSLLAEGLKVAKERGIPVVSNLQPYLTEQFPTREIARELGSSYFMPTMSYMIAYAIYLGYERIYIYGIDQGPNWQFQFGKPHICFWLGVAIGRRIEVRMGKGSLVWAYRAGLNQLPKAFLEEEYYSAAENIRGVIKPELFDEVILGKK